MTGSGSVGGERKSGSAWAPLRHRTFRTLWTAQLGSNVGTWMQTVGAQWMLVRQPHAAALTSAVQAASLLPVLFLSLPGGVLADVVNRKTMLVWLAASMAAVCGALTALTSAGLATPAVLLALTFLLGCGQALMNPAWQAIQPELVPREEIPAASALGSLNVNAARAVGPAVAGLLIAVAGTRVVFGINALSFVGICFAVATWRRQSTTVGEAEHMRPALAAGTRYVRAAPGVRRILLRAALFVVPASALWGLLPVVARVRLGLGSGGYGLLLGALGVGAVAGAAFMKPATAALGRNRLLALSSLVFAAGGAAAVWLTQPLAVAVVLVPTGVGWLWALSTFNTALQLTLPAWVRARGLAVYLIVFMGGQGVGSLLWGAVAAWLTPTGGVVIASALLALTTATLASWPLPASLGTLDREVVAPWPEPSLVLDPDPDDGPVVVEVVYLLDGEREPAFLEAMTAVERSRRRTGALRWTLLRDSEDVSRWVEVFEVASWSEHLRQHTSRTTGADAEAMRTAADLSRTPPQVRHLVPARTPTPVVASMVAE
ncbi:MFS transporter [Streptomyces sp. NPDC090306]|uniref:MFS transporter n=1 Tax=Streptomyces sp. NPDC090306 TaxID=3365961 RepID=UPI003824355D